MIMRQVEGKTKHYRFDPISDPTAMIKADAAPRVGGEPSGGWGTFHRAATTVDSLAAQLDEVFAGAASDKQWGAAGSAAALKAKLLGFMREKLEVGAPGEFAVLQTPEQLVDALLSDLDPPDLIDLLHRMLELVEARASNMAKPIPPPDQPEAMRGGRRSDRTAQAGKSY
jgi:hypothetical protein